MRKIGFLVTFLCVYSILMAQPDTKDKKVIQVVGSNICWELNYADDGLMTGIVDNFENGQKLLWSYDYHVSIDGMPYILQNGFFQPGNVFYYAEGEPTFIRESKLNSDGLISNDHNGNTFMWSTGEDFEYEYDEGRMVKMIGKHNGIAVKLSWMDGNLVQMVFLENNKEEGRIMCSYTDTPAKGICQAFNSPLMLLLSYYTIHSLGPLAHGYYGLLSQNLLSEMIISFSEKFIEEHSSDMNGMLSGNYYPITQKVSRKYNYTTDADGNIITITVSEENNENGYSLKYDNSSTDIAQDFYYYKGTKIPLTLNESKVCVSIFRDNKDLSKRILANVQVLDTIKDEDIFDIFVILRSDFEKLTSQDFWEEDAKSVILTSSYMTKDSTMEIYETPYLYVKLKKEEDIDLLTSYAKKYRLRIVRSFSQNMPLWYVLYVTPDNDKSPLECANELFESGDFAAAAPDLAGGIGLDDETNVRSITTATRKKSSNIYDLHGRILQQTPHKGVYIQSGKKVIVK